MYEVARRDVRLGLVVVVVADEVLDRVVREELAELRVELRGERLVRRDHDRRPPGRAITLAIVNVLPEPGHAEQRLVRAGPSSRPSISLAIASGWSPAGSNGRVRPEGAVRELDRHRYNGGFRATLDRITGNNLNGYLTVRRQSRWRRATRSSAYRSVRRRSRIRARSISGVGVSQRRSMASCRCSNASGMVERELSVKAAGARIYSADRRDRCLRQGLAELCFRTRQRGDSCNGRDRDRQAPRRDRRAEGRAPISCAALLPGRARSGSAIRAGRIIARCSSSAGFLVNSYRYYDAATHGPGFRRHDRCARCDARGRRHRAARLLPQPDRRRPDRRRNGTAHHRARPLARTWCRSSTLRIRAFGDGIDADAAIVRRFAATPGPMLVASSYSKSFSLYGERVGALSIVTRRCAGGRARALRRSSGMARTDYSESADARRPDRLPRCSRQPSCAECGKRSSPRCATGSARCAGSWSIS